MADRQTKIRGNQIKDLEIKNAEISESAGIEESKLSLNYPTHNNALDHAQNTDTALGLPQDEIIAQQLLNDNGGSGGWELGNTGNDTEKVGQTFTFASSCLLSKIALRIAKSVTQDANLNLNVYATTDGFPTGDSLGQVIKLASEISTSVTEIEFIFSSPINILASTEYAFVLTTTIDATKRYYIDHSYVEGAYTDGTVVYILISEPETWYNDPSDLYFKIYEQTITPVAVADIKSMVDDSHTHANSAALDDVSGVNTGDQTASTLPTDETGVSVQDKLDLLEGFSVNDYVSFELANETPDGLITEFTHDELAIEASVKVFLNGLLQQPGSGKDYTYSVSTKKAIFVVAPETEDIITFSYYKNN
jgi:hypothetical protein